ncbi:sulfite reductase (NADPH) flavoprotein alpha-component [Aureibacillus halotolerans]|uniref:assimilatory sulfite reductase (NADPH) n=1 Tax=Aureibacillus halotolerans TaxID=1508390 RepID=A0A4R6TTY1_9BACI|nr:sulfite reductase (NADPH) flavoprotein alpha-component [Aureibacillus halotolerans]
MLLETNSPFTKEQADLLNQVVPTLTESQKAWLSGYLAAGASVATVSDLPTTVAAPQTPEQTVSKDITVLFGSQTGNCRSLASSLTDKLQAQGFQVTFSSMNDFKTNTLKKVENLLLLVSTHGEGDPPDDALTFYEFVNGKRAPKFDHLKYSVLGLGDLSYEFYCQTGKDFDARFEELGGTRLTARVDCDVDYDDDAAEWMDKVLASLKEATSVAAPVTISDAAGQTDIASEYSRTNPFQAEVLENLNLNGRGSDRETRHLEISLEGSNLRYSPGDSLGIFPQNHPQLVEDVLAALKWDANELVTIKKAGEVPLKEALQRHVEVTVLTKPLLENLASLSSNAELQELVKPEQAEKMREYIHGRDLLDVIEDYKLQAITAKELIPVLRKLPARLYSISSSPEAYPEEVHLTVRKVDYESHGRQRYGVCSSHTADHLEEDGTLPVYIQHNPNFKLPANPDTPMIMIGPGTGVAPFRAFLGEKEESGDNSRTWLFFGDRHFSTDFLYQVEWQRWLKEGVLTNMDVAFSRDSAEKVYVQHRMLERGKELYEWLQDGAVVYVCGDEKQMAHDVHNALATILETEGGLSKEAAEAYLQEMQQEKRYQRDVY